MYAPSDFKVREFSRRNIFKARTPAEDMAPDDRITARHLNIYRKLPELDLFASNHVMVNRERKRRGIKVLCRSTDLDEIARTHAQAMARQCILFHSVSSQKELQTKLSSELVGENIQRGPSIRHIHRATVRSGGDATNLANIIAEVFTEFGVGSCKGKDGKIYLCQLFRRNRSIPLDDFCRDSQQGLMKGIRSNLGNHGSDTKSCSAVSINDRDDSSTANTTECEDSINSLSTAFIAEA